MDSKKKFEKFVGQYLHERKEEMGRLDWYGYYPVIDSDGYVEKIVESDNVNDNNLIVFDNVFLATESDGLEYCKSQGITAYYDRR